MMTKLEEATAAGWLDVDMSEGPNPIGARLLALWPEDGEVRRLFGLGHRENLVEPDAVHDPECGCGVGQSCPRCRPDMYETDEPFPYRASRWAGPGRRGISPGPEWTPNQGGLVSSGAPFVLEPGEDLVVPGLISATPTGTINLLGRKPVDE